MMKNVILVLFALAQFSLGAHLSQEDEYQEPGYGTTGYGASGRATSAERAHIRRIQGGAQKKLSKGTGAARRAAAAAAKREAAEAAEAAEAKELAQAERREQVEQAVAARRAEMAAEEKEAEAERAEMAEMALPAPEADAFDEDEDEFPALGGADFPALGGRPGAASPPSSFRDGRTYADVVKGIKGTGGVAMDMDDELPLDVEGKELDEDEFPALGARPRAAMDMDDDDLPLDVEADESVAADMLSKGKGKGKGKGLADLPEATPQAEHLESATSADDDWMEDAPAWGEAPLPEDDPWLYSEQDLPKTFGFGDDMLGEEPAWSEPEAPGMGEFADDIPMAEVKAPCPGGKGEILEKVANLETQVMQLAQKLQNRKYSAAASSKPYESVDDDAANVPDVNPDDPDAIPEGGIHAADNGTVDPDSAAAVINPEDAIEEEKSEEETALKEVNTECLKIDADKRLQCCQAECKKFGTRFNVTEQVQVTCMKPCMNAKAEDTKKDEKDTKKDTKEDTKEDTTKKAALSQVEEIQDEKKASRKLRDQEQGLDIGGGLFIDIPTDQHKDSRKGRDQEQVLDIGGGLSIDVPKDAAAARHKAAKQQDTSGAGVGTAKLHKDSHKGRDHEQGLDIGGGLFIDIPK